MAHPATLERLSIAIIVVNGKRIADRIKRSKGQELLRLRSLIQKLIWMLRLWNLPDYIISSIVNTDRNDSPKHHLALKNTNVEGQHSSKPWDVWWIRVQEIGHREPSVDDHSVAAMTTTMSFKNLIQFNRFKAFLRHLVSNWFEKIKVEKLYGNNIGFLVTHPAAALLYFYPDTSSKSTELSVVKTSSERWVCAREVLKVLKEVMSDDFCLNVLPEDDLDKTCLRKLESNVLKGKKSFGPSKRPVLPQDNRSLATEVFVFHDDVSSTFLKHPEQDNSLFLACSADQRSQFAAFGEPKGTQTAVSYSEELQIEIDRLSEMEIERNEADQRKVVTELKSAPSRDELQVDNDRPTKIVRNLEIEIERTEADHRKVVTELKSAPSREELQVDNDRLTKIVRNLIKRIEADKEIKRKEADYRKVIAVLESNTNKSTMEIASLKSQRKKTEEELGETLLELGRVSVEVTRITNEKKKRIAFDKAFKSRREHSIVTVSTQTYMDEASIPSQSSVLPKSTAGAEGGAEGAAKGGTEGGAKGGAKGGAVGGAVTSENLSVSIQESLEVSYNVEGASLTNMPTDAVERTLYNNYKLLLLTIADRLLWDDVNKLKTWASAEFDANQSMDINEVFWYLDQKKVIGPFDLIKLREFFERIVRIDMVCLIDYFLSGNYASLRKMNTNRILRNDRQTTVLGSRSATAETASSAARPRLLLISGDGRQPSEQARDAGPRHEEAEQHPTVIRPSLPQAQPRESSLLAASEVESETQTSRHAARVADVQPDPPKSRDSSATSTDGGHDDDDADDDADESHWLCSHYKRRCHVKFSCCDKFWPCHRCHNNESSCGQRKLTSRDTKFVKCVRCGTEQQFSATCQFCSKCHRKFSSYFCAICKHLTGTDDKPYHCQKCGICRIHEHRSFHCDVCGVCLDVQLRGNHKCRAGSAHDQCCICLEDAFTGCQILPCSHKVHKECASQMIRNGITRCPICRESFAHKLEKRNPPNPAKKPHGK